MWCAIVVFDEFVLVLFHLFFIPPPLCSFAFGFRCGTCLPFVFETHIYFVYSVFQFDYIIILCQDCFVRMRMELRWSSLEGDISPAYITLATPLPHQCCLNCTERCKVPPRQEHFTGSVAAQNPNPSFSFWDFGFFADHQRRHYPSCRLTWELRPFRLSDSTRKARRLGSRSWVTRRSFSEPQLRT